MRLASIDLFCQLNRLKKLMLLELLRKLENMAELMLIKILLLNLLRGYLLISNYI